MKIIIMRHGDAMFSGADRILSEQGKQEAKITALKLASHVAINRIFSSPIQRAMQTASIVKDNLRGKCIPEIEILPELEPCGDALMVEEYLKATCSSEDNVLLVSHIPQVANLSYTLVKKDFTLPMFHTASALIVDHDKPVLFFTPYGEVNF